MGLPKKTCTTQLKPAEKDSINTRYRPTINTAIWQKLVSLFPQLLYKLQWKWPSCALITEIPQLQEFLVNLIAQVLELNPMTQNLEPSTNGYHKLCMMLLWSPKYPVQAHNYPIAWRLQYWTNYNAVAKKWYNLPAIHELNVAKHDHEIWPLSINTRCLTHSQWSKGRQDRARVKLSPLAEELLLPHRLLAALLETASDYPVAVYTAPTSIYGYTITSTNLEVRNQLNQPQLIKK